jgi:CheY-like chemotaxis protein
MTIGVPPYDLALLHLSPLFSSKDRFSPLSKRAFFCLAWRARIAPRAGRGLVYDVLIFSFKQQPMHAPGTAARAIASYDWTTSDLGDPAGWPYPLRFAAELLLNSPAPILLVWGNGSATIFNDAYAALAGPAGGRAPGGSVPPVLPPPLAAGGEALARAWRGEASLQEAATLAFTRPDDPEHETRDLFFTPVRGEDGTVRGVLCALGMPRADAVRLDQGGGALRILVVEDNLDSQYLVCEMLKAFGHEAEGVAHPNDALALLAAHRYDVLFSDVSLPGMSGVDLARKAVGDQPGLKVIFASGYGDTLLRHLEFPYLSLQKPYELDQLQNALATIGRQLQPKA